MKQDSHTLMIVSGKTASVKKLDFNRSHIIFIILLMTICVAGLGYASYEYVRSSNEIRALMPLKKLALRQKKELDLLSSRSRDLETRIGHLQELDKKLRVLTNLKSSATGSRLLGVGGPLPDNKWNSEDQNKAAIIIETPRRNMDRFIEEARLREKSLQELLDYLVEQKSELASIPSIWPVMGLVTSEFGYRQSPFTDRREFHAGIDIANRVGEEIKAPAHGIVVHVSKIPLHKRGRYIKIDHGNGIETMYGHLLNIKVKKGQMVDRGDVIALVGNSGHSTGPHLHYGLKVNGTPVNPRKYLF